MCAVVVAFAVLAPLASGCASRTSSTSQSATGAPSELTAKEAEDQYGVAPTRNSDVVYQPDVVIPSGGGKAVRSVSPDGLTWTIDAQTPGAADVVPGKVMFLTGRGVGRVLHVARTGDDLAVTLGPVQLTDVIREAHLSGSQNVDPAAMKSYAAPDWPGAEADPVDASAASPSAYRSSDIGTRFASLSDARAGVDATRAALAPIPVPAVGPPSEVNLQKFGFNPFLNGGFGANFYFPVKNANLAPIQVSGSLVLKMSNPFVSYDINIKPSGIETAAFEVHNAAGLTIKFDAKTNGEFTPGDNVKKVVFLPMDLSIPLGGPVPLALTLHQTFFLDTGFSAKNSTVSATGEYGLSGSLKVECHYSSCHATAPGGFTLQQSMIDSMSGHSLSVNALIITYEARAIVGIGAFGFVTGPYVGLGVTAGVTRGADEAMVMCKQVDIAAWARGGVGYAMPPTVAKVLNFILSVFNVAPIPSVGGPGVSVNLFEPKHQRVGCGAG